MPKEARWSHLKANAPQPTIGTLVDEADDRDRARQPSLLERVESSGHGTGKLPSEVLLALPTALPDLATQERLAEPLRVMNERIAAARSESRH